MLKKKLKIKTGEYKTEDGRGIGRERNAEERKTEGEEMR
jgi:hypothetical protein